MARILCLSTVEIFLGLLDPLQLLRLGYVRIRILIRIRFGLYLFGLFFLNSQPHEGFLDFH
uniref:Uncharacterized protein n=1 Tax=Anguilla anguilla TaxID=7936 RepID=A0A0E9QE96_ANGAN